MCRKCGTQATAPQRQGCDLAHESHSLTIGNTDNVTLEKNSVFQEGQNRRVETFRRNGTQRKQEQWFGFIFDFTVAFQGSVFSFALGLHSQFVNVQLHK